MDKKRGRQPRDPKELYGVKFGDLTPFRHEIIVTGITKKYNNVYYDCHCKCGNVKLRVERGNLTRGNVVNCGCFKRNAPTKQDPDYKIGEIHKRLTILKFSHRRKKVNYYECLCECGNIKIMGYNTISNPRNIGCGCGADPLKCQTDKPNEYLVKRYYGEYTNSAQKRNHKFNITIDFFKELIFKNCHYCNREPSKIFKGRTLKDGSRVILICNGVDRKDSLIGYEVDNCVTCCKICNYMKSTIPYDEFLSHIANIANNRCKDFNK